MGSQEVLIEAQQLTKKFDDVKSYSLRNMFKYPLFINPYQKGCEEKHGKIK
jgi:hypothetical protein